MEIYSKNFTDGINKEFSLPLFEGTLIQDHAEESRLLTESAIKADITKEIDNELFLKYALFENALVSNMQNMILPEAVNDRVESFIESQDSEYFEVFTKNAKKLKSEITESIISMAAIIGPKLFEESSDLKDSGCEKFAGISAAIYKK